LSDGDANDLATARAIGNLEGTLTGIASTLVALDVKVDQSMSEGRDATLRIENRLGAVEVEVTALGVKVDGQGDELHAHALHDDERFADAKKRDGRQDRQLATLASKMWDLAIKVAAIGGGGYFAASQTGIIP